MKTNQYSGFHKLTLEQRAAEVAEFSGLTEEEIGRLTNPGALGNEVADHVIEKRHRHLSAARGRGHELPH